MDIMQTMISRILAVMVRAAVVVNVGDGVIVSEHYADDDDDGDEHLVGELVSDGRAADGGIGEHRVYDAIVVCNEMQGLVLTAGVFFRICV